MAKWTGKKNFMWFGNSIRRSIGRSANVGFIKKPVRVQSDRLIFFYGLFVHSFSIYISFASELHDQSKQCLNKFQVFSELFYVLYFVIETVFPERTFYFVFLHNKPTFRMFYSSHSRGWMIVTMWVFSRIEMANK